jgi:hypothetical protein
MTRASLLHLLAHPAALTGPDVRALEELAQTFPYCQTAHLLLAKAAHDQGSMLAAQRLRRAATYAADRAHLRRLIELPTAVAASATTVVATAPLASLPESAVFQPDLSTEGLTDETTTSTELLDDQEVVVLEDKPDQAIYSAEAPAETAAAVIEEELPAQAPPIRPPAKAQAARFEFGLAVEEPAEIMAYQLPEADAAEPMLAVAAAMPPATPALPPFSGVPDVHYAPSEGSRLGFCLVPAESTALLPSAALPPGDEFFAPDGLLLAHLAMHQLPALPKPSSLDLINSFLQRAPAPSRRRTAPVLDAPEPEAQADLSVRSTRPEPDLASENLAKILVRQGKIDRAIAVYERLMVKQPEKMAYFAAQIESLRPSA